MLGSRLRHISMQFAPRMAKGSEHTYAEDSARVTPSPVLCSDFTDRSAALAHLHIQILLVYYIQAHCLLSKRVLCSGIWHTLCGLTSRSSQRCWKVACFESIR
jgi:hypothetical protein